MCFYLHFVYVYIIHIYLKSMSTYKEAAILRYHLFTVTQNLDLLGVGHLLSLADCFLTSRPKFFVF